MVKRRSKIILGIASGIGGLLFSLYFPPTRLFLGKTANQSASASLRVWGLSVLGEHPDPENMLRLQEALFDEDPEVRLAAVNALGQLGENAASASGDLVKAARDEDNDVSKAAATALNDIGAAGVPGLIEQLAAQDPRYRQAAATALLNLKEAAEPARPALLKAIHDENVGVQILSMQCLRFLPKPELSVPSMLKLLDFPNESVRASAVKVTRSLVLTPGYLEKQNSVSTKVAELILGELMKAL
ncbi:MAG: HEAT repeat domain-containing protein, partial [Planctomycetota bacterium]|nr:HEAT repeat domain-containing protein [Planctomycetota bacterium]